MSYKAHMHGGGESYSGVVPAKQPNKSGRPPAEVVEERPLTKENMDQLNLCRTQSRESGPNGLDRVREAARRDGKLRFTALLHHVTVDLLWDSYHSLKKRAAPGVDGVTWEEYGQDPGGATARPAWANPSRGLSSETITESLDPERRWKATTIGNRGTGRQSRTVRGRDGPQPDLGRGLSGFFVWIPARAEPARCAGRALRRNHTQEGELGARLGYPGIFRSNRTFLDDQVCRAPNWRQEDRPLDPEMVEGGRDGARSVGRDKGGDSARCGDFAASGQSLPALCTRPLGRPVAAEGSDGRCDYRPLRGRRCTGVPAPKRSRAVPGAVAGTAGEIRTGATSRENAPD